MAPLAGIKAVVFDIGNVLIEWQPERFYDGVIGPEQRRALFEAVDLHCLFVGVLLLRLTPTQCTHFYNKHERNE